MLFGFTLSLRLSSLEKDAAEEGQEKGWKWLTTKFVFDWRFREGKWTRRARLVARDFKTAETRNDCFAPATSSAVVRIIPALALQSGMKIWALDVKDAFLQVRQKTPCACRMPAEYKEIFPQEEGDDDEEVMVLERVLPGQRDAAVLWSDFFSNDLRKEGGMERSIANPTLFRSKAGSMLVIHVDDFQGAEVGDDLSKTISKDSPPGSHCNPTQQQGLGTTDADAS